LGVKAIKVTGELLPGLACGAVCGGMADGVQICTKPGGFGETNSLRVAVGALCSGSQQGPISD
jgi:uncharacterized protein YgbK (DUF1537 family)